MTDNITFPGTTYAAKCTKNVNVILPIAEVNEDEDGDDDDDHNDNHNAYY